MASTSLAWSQWLVRHRAAIEAVPADFVRTGWEWGRTDHMVHGVDVQRSGGLLWYSTPKNPHAGGGASSQALLDFMNRGQGGGPAMPDDLLAELVAVVERRLGWN